MLIMILPDQKVSDHHMTFHNQLVVEMRKRDSLTLLYRLIRHLSCAELEMGATLKEHLHRDSASPSLTSTWLSDFDANFIHRIDISTLGRRS